MPPRSRKATDDDEVQTADDTAARDDDSTAADDEVSVDTEVASRTIDNDTREVTP